MLCNQGWLVPACAWTAVYTYLMNQHQFGSALTEGIVLQMKEADKGKNGKRKGRGDADDGDSTHEISRKFFKKRY